MAVSVLLTTDHHIRKGRSQQVKACAVDIVVDGIEKRITGNEIRPEE
jgi:hypothetical protein